MASSFGLEIKQLGTPELNQALVIGEDQLIKGTHHQHV